jgi:hypothetical protein
MDILELIKDKNKVLKWLVNISKESKEAFEILEVSRKRISEDSDLEIFLFK